MVNSRPRVPSGPTPSLRCFPPTPSKSLPRDSVTDLPIMLLPAHPRRNGPNAARTRTCTYRRPCIGVYRPASNYRLVLSERNNAKARFTLTLVKRKIDRWRIGGRGGSRKSTINCSVYLTASVVRSIRNTPLRLMGVRFDGVDSLVFLLLCLPLFWVTIRDAWGLRSFYSVTEQQKNSKEKLATRKMCTRLTQQTAMDEFRGVGIDKSSGAVT